jgi:hypothetical protein
LLTTAIHYALFAPAITMRLWDYMAMAYPFQANSFSLCAEVQHIADGAAPSTPANAVQQGRRVGFEMFAPSAPGVDGESDPNPAFGGTFAQALAIGSMASPQWLKMYQADGLNAITVGLSSAVGPSLTLSH